MTWGPALVMSVLLLALMVGVGALVLVLAKRAARGGIQRNRAAGIRTKATLASDEAWLAGQQAGERWTVIGGWLLVASGVAPLLVAGLASPLLDPEQFVGIHIGGLVGLVGVSTAAVVYGAIQGHRAAKAVVESGAA